MSLRVTNLPSPAQAPQARYHQTSIFPPPILLNEHETAVKAFQRPSAHLLPPGQAHTWLLLNASLCPQLQALCVLAPPTHSLTSHSNTAHKSGSPRLQLSPETTHSLSLRHRECSAWKSCEKRCVSCSGCLAPYNQAQRNSFKTSRCHLLGFVLRSRSCACLLPPQVKGEQGDVKRTRFHQNSRHQKDKMMLGTLQAFLYFTGLFLAGILLGHVQRTKTTGKCYCRNNVWGRRGAKLRL